MKRILATTAMALMLGTAAVADNHMSAMKTHAMEEPGDIFASNLIGMRVYAVETDLEVTDEGFLVDAKAEKDWDDIGEVNDIVLGKEGKVKAVILGVGGFIGIGEKDVAVSMDQIKRIREPGNKEKYFLVVKANKQSLTDAPAYKRMDESVDEMKSSETTGSSEMKQDTSMKTAETGATAESEAKPASDETATSDNGETRQEMAESKQMDGNRPMLMSPRVEREGYRVAEVEELTAEMLQGATVYDTKDENIGEINRLILTEDGNIKRVIVDVGGFLGLGEHPIAVTMDELRILRTDNGSDVRVYINATQEELEKQPAYSG